MVLYFFVIVTHSHLVWGIMETNTTRDAKWWTTSNTPFCSYITQGNKARDITATRGTIWRLKKYSIIAWFVNHAIRVERTETWVLAQYVGNGVPTCWFICWGEGLTFCPLSEFGIRYLIIFVVVPYIIYIGSAVVSNLCLPMLSRLHQDVDLCSWRSSVGNNRCIGHIYNIWESICIKFFNGYAIYLDVG